MEATPRRTLSAAQPDRAGFSGGDGLILLGLVAVIYLGVRLSVATPVIGPAISLEPAALPGYALLSVGRMAAAYTLALLFALVYGYFAATNRRAERVLLPLLDILQSVPILSFLPVFALALTAILPQSLALELAAVLLIFTSQVWNLTYSYYQSLRTQPRDLGEAVAIFRFNWWYRFRHLHLSFAAIGLLWNSVMSWAGGWFFLMASETFHVGERDFRLPGLGSFLQKAADEGDTRALLLGMGTLVLVVVLLDQLVWQPLLAWSEKFKGGNVENDNPPQSWFLNALSGSILAAALYNTTLGPLLTWLDRRFGRAVQSNLPALPRKASRARRLVGGLLRLVLIGAVLAALAYLVASAADMLLRLPLSAYAEMLGGLLATALRVAAALLIAVAWTVPLGVLIGTRPRLAAVLQPIIQVVAAIPATAFFPLLVLALVATPLGLNGAAVLLMLLGTQWYLLFNVIAGASAMPADLINITDVLRIGGLLRLRVLILPSLFPYIVTGMITASGGAWNASIVAEYTRLSGQTYSVPGLGATISAAAASADYGRLLASTLLMIFTVVGLNRLVWRRLYRLAGERYRMDG